MQRDRLRITAGQPLTFTLNGHSPRQIRSSIDGAIDWQYVVNDGNAVVYLPDSVHRVIQNGQLPSGTQVQVIKPAAPGAPWNVRSNHTPAKTAAAAAPRQTTSAPRPAPEASGAEMVASYLYCAIDAAVAASAYAKQKYGVVLQFDAEQIRTLAVTLLINGSKEGR